jgi:hypothetical protein
MQSKLSQNQVEKVSERYLNHPLLLACRKAFGCYEADLQGLLIAPEEMFLESAIILDDLLTDPNKSEDYVKSLWYQEKTKIKRWVPQAPQDSLNKVAGAILFVVAGVLCLHWHSDFNEDLKEKILELARKNMNIDIDEEKRIIGELSGCAEGLEKWLNSYVETENYLSEDIIMLTVSPQMNVVEPLTAQQQPQITKQQHIEALLRREIDAAKKANKGPKYILLSYKAAIDASAICDTMNCEEFNEKYGCSVPKSSFTEWIRGGNNYSPTEIDPLIEQFRAILNA